MEPWATQRLQGIRIMRGIPAGMRTVGRLACICAWAVLLPVGGVSAIGLVVNVGWPLELFPHFAIQCAAAQVLAILVFALRRKRLPALLGLSTLLIIVAPIARYYLAMPILPTAPYSLRVMTLNVDSRNARSELARHAIVAETPDVIFLSEASAQWISALPALRKIYPFEVGDMSDPKSAVLLLSRFPLQDAEVHRLEPGGDPPAISARLCTDRERTDGPCLTVIGIHAAAPITRARAEARDAVFRVAADLLAGRHDGRAVLLGDLNATPWSPAFRRLLGATSLRDSGIGFGLHPTWGSRSLLFGQPIDHVLVDQGITVVDRRVGGDVGSDHYPLVVDLSF
jgi:endonuclease/exonuclease/phosphatase (EEP) superfamily protein YafD